MNLTLFTDPLTKINNFHLAGVMKKRTEDRGVGKVDSGQGVQGGSQIVPRNILRERRVQSVSHLTPRSQDDILPNSRLLLCIDPAPERQNPWTLLNKYVWTSSTVISSTEPWDHLSMNRRRTRHPSQNPEGGTMCNLTLSKFITVSLGPRQIGNVFQTTTATNDNPTTDLTNPDTNLERSS